MKNLCAWAALFLCAATIIVSSSCSKQTNADAQSTTAATGGKSGAAGKAGTAGTAGSKATSTATAGTGAAVGAVASQANGWSVPCGSATCKDDYMVGMACCADETKGTCGVFSGTCEPRATPNPKCPGVMFPVTVPGCCLADGTTCGVDGYPAMPGCVPIDVLVQYGLTPPDDTHCDGTPIGGMAGAGGSKAGGAGGASGAMGK
jgi:hypothetical protein